MPSRLSELYDHIMARIEGEKESDLNNCRNVLVAAFLAYRPLSLLELTVVADLPNQSASTYVEKCRSFLTIRKADNTVHLVHQSAKEYLGMNYQRRLQLDGAVRGHWDISTRSVDAISNLKRNIYGFPNWGYNPEDFKRPKPDPLDPLRYSCTFWAHHLHGAASKSSEWEVILAKCLPFLKHHFCTWLESLSLMKRLADGIFSIRKLRQATSNRSSSLDEFLKDAERFTISHRSIIERIPLQVYAAALAFSPTNSTVRKLLWNQRCLMILNVNGTRENWDSCLQILEGHDSYVNAVTFSRDGSLLASASSDRTVRLWDSDTGCHIRQISGHTGYVLSVALSPDSKLLASSSSDRTVRVWDVETGNPRELFKCDTHWVNAVAFSHDGKILAGASNDYTILLWNLTTGNRQILRGHDDSVNAIAFSPNDDTMLASASSDRTVMLWNLALGTQQRYEGHVGSVNAVAFRPDGKSFASASTDQTVRHWCLTTGVKHILTDHLDSVNAVAFSSDGTILASASSDRKIRLWDVATGICKETLEGHRNWVNSIAFSPTRETIASASSDYTVRLWSVTSEANQESFRGHSRSVNAVTFSSDGKTVATGSSDQTIQLWDGTTGYYQTTLEGHEGYILAVTFSNDCTHIASASSDKTARVWNVATGEVKVTLHGHHSHVLAISFSPNDELLVSASSDWRVRIWDIRSGQCLQTLEGHQNGVTAVAFSPDGKKIASASREGTTRLWVPALGRKQLEALNWQKMKDLAFSPGGEVLATVQGDDMEKLWDRRTFAYQRTLIVTRSIGSLSFSRNNQYLKTDRDTFNLGALTDTGADTESLSAPSEQLKKAQDPMEMFHFPRNDDGGPEWKSLEPTIFQILSARDAELSLDMKTYMRAYTAVHNYCTSKRPVRIAAISVGSSLQLRAQLFGEELYTVLQDYLTKYLKELVRVSAYATDEALLAFYTQEWTHFTKAAKYINFVFRYMNRHWENYGYGPKTGREERNGEIIKYGPVKQFVDSLVSMYLYVDDEMDSRSSLDVYLEHFERPFLEATRLFYEAESKQLIASNGVAEYMKKAEVRLDEEVERVRTYLHASSEIPLGKACNKALFEDHVDILINEFPTLFDEACEDDMARMYKLLSRIPDGVRKDSVDSLMAKFEPILRKAGLAAVVEADSDVDKLEPRVFVGTFNTNGEDPNGTEDVGESTNNAISLNEEWICRGGENLVWLPPDYRATCAAVYDNMLVLGHRSGQVTFMKLAES